MNRQLKALAALLLAGVLASCGGGGGSPGSTGTGTGTDGTGTGTGTGGTTPTPVAASMIFELSKPALDNSGTDSTVLTATALDANNNPVAGVPFSVSVDSGVFTPDATATGADGRATGKITIGGNKTNRNITAAIKVGTQTATAVVPVAGGQITVSPVPATPAPGQSVRVDVKVVDSTGAAVVNTPVTFSGSLGLTGTVNTDVNGNATGNLGAAPATPGTYTVEVAALGVQGTRSVQVISGAGSGIADAVGPISSASLAIVPNTIGPNTVGSSTNRAALRAKFLNASNQAVQNVRVRFQVTSPSLGPTEALSTADGTVFTDVNGEAIADYIAGTRSSPTNGVTIRACYGLTDASIANGACPNQVTGALTVASQPLSITLGDNNLLARGNNSLTYIKQFDVAVVDAAGNAVSGAQISASVDILTYDKGATFTAPRVTCANEDLNRNGALDTSPVEDVNGNGTLEPHKADIALSFLGSNATGANGRMSFQVEYPQNVATWLSYTVKVTTSVNGSEGTVSKNFVTGFIEGDQTNGSFRTPPYGAALDCTSPN
ncbi:Ig-like domain-containing protein [Ramlibacter sp. AN1133]|uniref:Ig-like domain-containing protein n=1 Tax=Ramlibacter sp. AN1133 TaxID=3133429 RepID=UPI0030C64DCC